MFPEPQVDRGAPLQFVINSASGHHEADATRTAIEAGLLAARRTGKLQFTRPGQLPEVAAQAAAKARTERSAVVAVGGDGTINAVAQAAYSEGCAMGVLPQGTFNYFSRTHGIPPASEAALRVLFEASAHPVQVGAVNGKLFLVNASLGLYPALLEDREAYKARFGRSRLVAMAAAFATLLREHRQLHLRIEHKGATRDVRTPTLFVGNNRLQLQQVGLRGPGVSDSGTIAGVMLRPIGMPAMIWLVLCGAFGSLGDAENVVNFDFQHMVVRPSRRYASARVKVACDGEVSWQRWPLHVGVAEKPLWLLKPAGTGIVADPEAAGA